MAVERVLQAFSKRNPSIGYCQGMNFIVARLKKYLNEEVRVIVKLLGHILGIYHDSGVLFTT